MKKQRTNASPLSGLLSIKSIFAQSQSESKELSIERTFSNESTVEKDRDAMKRQIMQPPPRSPTSVTQCDIFRPLRETFFSEEKEDMLTIRRATPICCGSLLDLDEEEDDVEAVAPVPLTRQDAITETVLLLEKEDLDDEETLFGENIEQEQGCDPQER